MVCTLQRFEMHYDDDDNDNNDQQVCGWAARQWLRSRLLCHFKHLTELPHGYCQVRGTLCLLGICLYATFEFRNNIRIRNNILLEYQLESNETGCSGYQ